MKQPSYLWVSTFWQEQMAMQRPVTSVNDCIDCPCMHVCARVRVCVCVHVRVHVRVPACLYAGLPACLPAWMILTELKV